ncbi:hypothetical protein, partial [Brachybacterium aquaticum]|uniref:hypothetical protein n=1 Tax=Brachybacterium aquaticum TaxID=1432564 RepID=UPI001C868230
SRKIACNRRVHAEIQFTDPVRDYEHIEARFREEEWSFDRLSTEKYLVSIPVYSAAVAALDVARGKVLDFGESVATLELLSLRSQSRPPSARFVYRSKRTRKESVSRMLATPPRFGAAPRQVPAPVWEVRGEFELPPRLLDDLEPRFTPHYAGGELELREVASPPDRPAAAEEVQGWKSVLDSTWLFVVLSALVVVSLGLGPVETVPWWVRGLLYLVSTVLGVVAGRGVARNVSGKLAKIGTVLLLLLAMVMVGAVFWALYLGNDGYPWTQMLVAVALFGVARGIFHLVVLRPRVRVMLSLSVATALVAVSFGVARFMLSGIGSDFGVPVSMVAVPDWVGPAAGLLLLAHLLVGVILAGALWGWVEYFGISTAFRTAPDFLGMLGGMLFFVMLLGAFLAGLRTWEIQYREWLSGFSEGTTPSVTADFMYRACVSELPTTQGSGKPTSLATDHPLVVIEGTDGPGWVWDATASATQSSTATIPIATDSLELARVNDDVTECAAP